MKHLRLGTSLFLAIALTVINISTALAAAPVQLDVTSSLPNGSYKAGQVVPVQVVFPFAVFVTGTPQLTLSTGNPSTTNVNYSSGSGSNTLVFNYTVAAGNRSADLDYASNHSLSTNGGTIKDSSAQNVNFKLAVPGATGSLGANKNIVIDTTPPFFSAVAPIPNAFINSVTTLSDVGYTMSETIASGSITIVQTGGTPTDAGSPHVCDLIGTALSSGVHNNLDLSNTTNGCKVAQSLVDGVIYSFTFEGIDSAGNVAVPVTRTNVTFDKTAPTINIGPPSVLSTSVGPVTYAITYSDAHFNASTLRAADITLNATGDANGIISVDAGTGASRTVTISNITGSGTLGISIAAGTASDLAGNLAPAAGPSTTFQVLNIKPVFTSVSPQTNAFINSITTSSDVSYTLNEPIVSGTITMTQTGGAPTDTGSPHVCNLTGTALSGGTHNNLDLSNTTNGCTAAQSLVNGAVYSFAFNGIDAAGIPAATVTSTGVTFDTTAPIISAVSPVTGAVISSITTSSAVSYTLSEPIASGRITMTWTGGTADPSSPHICTLTGTALGSGAHGNLNLSDTTNSCTQVQSLISGAVYTFTFNATDAAGNLAAPVTSTNVTFETSSPVFFVISPASGAFINSITTASDVSYALSKSIVSGSITMTRTSGTPDAGSPHICFLKGTALNSGAHNNLDLSNTINSCTVPQFLVNGTVYTFTFNGVDSVGHAAPTVTISGVTFDTSAPIISSVTPLANTYINSITSSSGVSYTLNEVASSGSITMTRTGGMPDGGSPHICTLIGTALNDGVHASLDLSDTINACTVVQSLVNGAVYTFTFNAADLAGNSASPIIRTNVTFDKVVPAFSAVLPLTNAYIKSITTTSNVSYTLSKTLVSGSITMTWTGGASDQFSPHICTLTGSALNVGVHANLDLSNTIDSCTVAQSLIDGAIYTFTYNGFDAAGNDAPTVTTTGITFDSILPTTSWILPPPCGSSPCMYTVANQPYQLTVDASDNLGISMVVFKRYDYLNHSRVELGRATSPPYTITFDTSQLLPSNNEIDAIALDAANNSTWIFLFLNHSSGWQTYLPLITR